LTVHFLLLKVASAVGMGLVLKQAETRGVDRLPMIRINYAIAAVLAFLAVVAAGSPAISRPTAILAVITGGLFVAGLLTWTRTIQTAGLALSVVAMRTAVVIPVLASVVIWHERPGLVQLAGVVLALLALALVLWDVVRRPRRDMTEGETSPPGPGSRALWLALLFLVDGLVMIPAQVFRRELPQAENLPFQTVIFVTAFFITTIIYYLGRQRVTQDSLRFGALLGAANLGNYLFLVMALALLPGVVVFPVMAAGEVGLAALAGVLIWRERVGLRSWAGIALAVVALVLVQVGR
jgi:Ca2+/Na+ antiporter